MKLRNIHESYQHPTVGEYTATEVTLADGILGDVHYEYEISESGGVHMAASHMDPASSPGMEVSKLHTVDIIKAYTDMGQEVPVMPEYTKAAVAVFWKQLAHSLAKQTERY